MILRVQDEILEFLKQAERRYRSSEFAALKQEVEKRKEGWQAGLPALSEPQHLLIFKPDDIGDAVQALPAILELRKKFSQAKFYLLCQSKTKAIYEASKLFDQIVTIDVQLKFVRFPSMDLEGALSKFTVKQFDVAIFLRTYSSYFSYFKKLPANAFVHPRDPRMRSRSPYQVTLSMHGENVAHQSLLMLELVSLLTRKFYKLESVCYPKLQFEKVSPVEGDIALIHPFAKFETKNFGEAKWLELLSRLEKSFPNLKWVIIGGKEDPTLSLSTKFFQLQGKISLAETGALMQKAKFFIGNESGPGHLASAIGVPTITLMGGHSNPEEWRTLGKSLLLRNPVVCSPCHRRVCPGLGLKCLEELTVTSVFSQIQNWLLTLTDVAPKLS